MISITESLALRLLRIIFGSYFLVTLTVTCVQLFADYQHTKSRVANEIESMDKTFGPGIANSMWRFQDEVQRSILNGVSQLPVVTGAKIQDKNGKITYAIGVILDDDGKTQLVAEGGRLLPYEEGMFDKTTGKTFPVIYTDERYERHWIGSWTVYSNQQVIIRQVEYGFFLILINSVIKTIVLWFIFLYVFRRWLGKPIAELSEFVRLRNLENLDNQKFELSDPKPHELHFLADAINGMLSRLQESIGQNKKLYAELQQEKESLRLLNATLEERIANRTEELQQVNHRLQMLSLTDGLTGIPNRRCFDITLASEWKRAARTSTPLTLAMIDVDWFKSFNDHYGHQAGDEVLRRVASSLKATICRAGDLVARYGGEEFVFIAPNTAGEDALNFAHKVCHAIAELKLPHQFSDVKYITVSIGVASFIPRWSQDVDDLIKAADNALYSAKEAGRNRVVLSVLIKE